MLEELGNMERWMRPGAERRLAEAAVGAEAAIGAEAVVGRGGREPRPETRNIQ